LEKIQSAVDQFGVERRRGVQIDPGPDFHPLLRKRNASSYEKTEDEQCGNETSCHFKPSPLVVPQEFLESLPA
jgi:hypothetical protein